MNSRAYLFLLAAALFWGGNNVAGKFAVGHVSPGVLTGLRWLVALAVLAWFARKEVAKDWPVIRANWWKLFAYGAVGFAGFNIAIYTAASMTSIVNMSIEQAAMPILIFLINFLIFRIGVAWLQVAGVLASLVGIAIVATAGDLSRLASMDLNLGDALNLLACLFYAGYTALLRFRPALHCKSWMMALGFAAFLTSLPFIAWEAATSRLIWPDFQGWMAVLYTGLFPSLLSQTFYLKGNEMIGANRAGLFINMVPVFGTIQSIVLLGEPFHGYQMVAFVLVMGGIAVAEWAGRRRAAR